MSKNKSAVEADTLVLTSRRPEAAISEIAEFRECLHMTPFTWLDIPSASVYKYKRFSVLLV